ncbi:hypothetical protein [Modestobacter roseus]|uniref:Uncharacterized protein n=1 Tax=Modestobacter roseus TaxID=1181884 RepID=A0A562IUM0_9ACTN|nr:hypothetical protein [Modestobacter roseus]MQA33079.1 hypothetical protein [Modestobacter roseus]TWH74463.1 hypothetical protein JD78_03002 [Modestobacter roseus]
MVDQTPAPARQGRALIGLVAASALAYPLLLCAVQLLVVQLFQPDPGRLALWGAVAVACSLGMVAAVRWGAGRRIRSPWLLVGLVPPVLFELWVCWPLLTR